MNYWKNDDLGNKVSTDIPLTVTHSSDNTSGTSNIHIAGLDSNKTYCVQVTANISPYGESYTDYGSFHPTHDPSEKCDLGRLEFNTLTE